MHPEVEKLQNHVEELRKQKTLVERTYDEAVVELSKLKQSVLSEEDKQSCPRRMGELGPWEHVDNLDAWERRDGEDAPRYCSFCGGMHPEDVIVRILAGDAAERTTKGYKAYLITPWGQKKVYMMHFTHEQIDRANAANAEAKKKTT